MVKQKERGSLTQQAFWLLLAKALAFSFAFALPVLLTRTLSQNEYGLFKQVFLIIMTATSLLPFGFGLSAYYYLPRENDAGRRGQVILNILLFNLILGAITFGVFVFWPNLIAGIFRDPSIPSYAPLVGAVILLWLFASFLETVAVANQELTLASIFIVAGQLTRTTLLLAAAILFNTVQSLVYAALIHGVLQSIALVWYTSSRFPGFWQAFDWSLTKKQIGYAVPFGLAGLLFTLQTDLHNYFVSHQFSAATFAIYSIGVAQLPFIGILRESVSSVMLPRISYLQEQGMEREIVLLIANATRKLAAVILPVFAFFMVTGQEFLTVVFTSAYKDSWPIFAINLLLLPISLIEVDAVMRAYEQCRFFVLKVQVVLSVAMLFALWYGISRFGLIGAISVVVVVNLVLRTVLAAKLVGVLGVKLRDVLLLKDVGKLMLASIVAGVATLYVRSMMLLTTTRPFSVLLICFSVFALAYLATVLLLRVPTHYERYQAWRAVERLQQMVFMGRSTNPVS